MGSFEILATTSSNSEVLHIGCRRCCWSHHHLRALFTSNKSRIFEVGNLTPTAPLFLAFQILQPTCMKIGNSIKLSKVVTLFYKTFSDITYGKFLFGVKMCFFYNVQFFDTYWYFRISITVNRKINNMWLPCQQDPLLMVRSPVASYYPRYVESI